MIERFRALLTRESVLLVVLLFSGCALWAFIELQDEVRDGEAFAFDERILLSFREPGNPDELRGPRWLEKVSRDITALGGNAVLTLVTIGAGGFFLLRRQWVPLAVTLTSAIGGALLVDWLKSLYERERPTITRHLMEEASHSFPSGHSTMAVVIYLTLAVTLAEFQEKRRLRVYILGYAATLAALIGLSRVILGVHYPSDVAAGWTIGILWAGLTWIAVRLMKRRHPGMESGPE